MGWCNDSARRRPREAAVPTTALLLDPAEVRRLIRHRQKCGGDRYDEVWDGVYVMAPWRTTNTSTSHLRSPWRSAGPFAFRRSAGCSPVATWPISLRSGRRTTVAP